MSVLAIIPARGGSKRIPGKNIKLFCNRVIMGYSINNAKALFNNIMVSTDSLEIAKIAKRYGVEVPFMRSPKNSNDKVGLLEVVKEVIENYNRSFDYVCCILPTAPMITTDDISRAFNVLYEYNYDSVFAAVKYSYPIQRAIKIEKNSLATMIHPKNYNKRSQDLEQTYHDAGQFYWIRPDRCFKKNRIFTNNTGCIVLPSSRVQDIDDIEDWKLCEEKYRRLYEI